MEIVEATNSREGILSILSSEKLPASDLPGTLENFRIARQNEEIIGVIGLEIYGDYGLLRSLAVLPVYRTQGIASKLISEIEAIAKRKDLKAIYLLTETASAYFDRKGYLQISRAEVPAEIQTSSEFSHVCPQSAIVMKKTFEK